jgi:lactoylglutathione lyase
MLKAMRHVGIVVKDLDKMLTFYRDFLGLTVFSDFRENGKFINTLQGLQGADVRMVKLALPDGSLIELLCDDGHPDEPLIENRLCDPGVNHVAFTVDDVDDSYQKVLALGLKTLSPPILAQDGKARLFFARDPEGNPLEIVEMLEKA